MPVFANEVTIGGRLVAAPDPVTNERDHQIRFTLAHPIRFNKAYYIEINVFGDLAALCRDGGRNAGPLGKGDTVLIKGTLSSYTKKVTGAKGQFGVTRVSVVATEIERTKAGKAATEREPGEEG
jgi:hypothetical protein